MRGKLCLLTLLAIATLSAAGDAGAQNVNLTGVWHTMGGVTFYVRQTGNQVWWLGEQSPANPLWTNVASGTIDGGVVRVKWVDIPKGRTTHEGTLTLRVVTPNHLVVIQNPNDFWSADWTR